MTKIVWFPIKYRGNSRGASDVSMWEKTELVAFLQAHWSDNQVSATITYDPETEGSHIENVLNYYQYRLKSISFLPIQKNRLVNMLDIDSYVLYNKSITDEKPYADSPFESISEDTYKMLISEIKEVNYSKYKGEAQGNDSFCDGLGCENPQLK